MVLQISKTTSPTFSDMEYEVISQIKRLKLGDISKEEALTLLSDLQASLLNIEDLELFFVKDIM